MSGVELLPFVWALPLAYFAASYGNNGGHQLSSASSLSEDQPAPGPLRQQQQQQQQDMNIIYEGLPGHWKLDDGGEEEESRGGIPSVNHIGRRSTYKGDDEEDAGLMTILFTGSECMCFRPYLSPENTNTQ